MGDRMVVVVELPQELGKVSALLSALGKAWPDSKVAEVLPGDERVLPLAGASLVEIGAET